MVRRECWYVLCFEVMRVKICLDMSQSPPVAHRTSVWIYAIGLTLIPRNWAGNRLRRSFHESERGATRHRLHKKGPVCGEGRTWTPPPAQGWARSPPHPWREQIIKRFRQFRPKLNLLLVLCYRTRRFPKWPYDECRNSLRPFSKELWSQLSRMFEYDILCWQRFQ